MDTDPKISKRKIKTKALGWHFIRDFVSYTYNNLPVPRDGEWLSVGGEDQALCEWAPRF